MKRFHAWLMVASLLLVAVPAFADWEASNVAWYRVNASNVTGFPNRPDTLWTTFAASKVDTSASFTLADCDPLSVAVFGATADTVHYARLVIYADSSTAATVNFKATTCAIQANFGDQNASWQTAFTVTSSVTDGQKAWVIPLGAISAAGDGSIDLTSKLAIVGPRLRVIVTGGASVAGNAMRIKLYKWKN